jgi:hypothetical protein
MTEAEYLLVTNRVRITHALELLRGVVCLPKPGDDAIFARSVIALSQIEQDLFSRIETLTK